MQTNCPCVSHSTVNRKTTRLAHIQYGSHIRQFNRPTTIRRDATRPHLSRHDLPQARIPCHPRCKVGKQAAERTSSALCAGQVSGDHQAKWAHLSKALFGTPVEPRIGSETPCIWRCPPAHRGAVKGVLTRTCSQTKTYNELQGHWQYAGQLFSTSTVVHEWPRR